MIVEFSSEKCPICRKPTVDKFKPFCSSRCSLVDLGKWLGEAYSVPAQEFDEEELELAAEMLDLDEGGGGKGGEDK